MQSLHTAPLENDCCKDIRTKLNNGLDFLAVYALNSQKCSERRQKLTRFSLSFFGFGVFLPKEILEYIYVCVCVKSEKLFTALATHCPSSQFHLAQVTYYPILLLQDRKETAKLSSDCVPRIFLDSRMWKHLAQLKKKIKKIQQISKKQLEANNNLFPSLWRKILPETSLEEALNIFNSCPAEQYRCELKIHSSMHIFLSPSTVSNPAKVQIIPHCSISLRIYQRNFWIQPLKISA